MKTLTLNDKSYFDGKLLGLIGRKILLVFLTIITLGLAFPWTFCMVERWMAKHTLINGKRLKFIGRGGNLFGKYLLWCFLTIITFGIFGIWFGLNLEKWRVKHLVYEDDKLSYESEFTAHIGEWFANCFIKSIIIFSTFGLGYSLAEVRFMKWKAERTIIGGSSLVFKGLVSEMFVEHLISMALTPLTLGVYSLIFPIIILRWKVSNTEALYKTDSVRALATTHETEANLDFVKFALSANNDEANILNIETISSETDVEILESAAKLGNKEAPWLLKNYYEQLAHSIKTSDNASALDALKRSAYWFKISIEQENNDALSAVNTYNDLIDTIALWQAQEHKPGHKASAIHVISGILAIIFSILLAAASTYIALSFTVLSPKREVFDGEKFSYICMSETMCPTLELGMEYYFYPVENTDVLKPNDIVLVKRADSIMQPTRIYEVTKQNGQKAYVVKGDSEAEPESEPYFANEILGVLK